MPDESFSDAVSRRGVRVSECVRLPVYTLDMDVARLRVKAKRAETRQRGKIMMRAYASVEANGRAARIKGEPSSNNPYLHSPSKANAWYHAWRRGWERG